MIVDVAANFYAAILFLHIAYVVTPAPIVGTILVHRLRRWPSIDPTLGKCIAFAGTSRHFVFMPSFCFYAAILFLQIIFVKYGW